MSSGLELVIPTKISFAGGSASISSTGAVSIISASGQTATLQATSADVTIKTQNSGNINLTLARAGKVIIAGSSPASANPATDATELFTLNGVKGGAASIAGIAGGKGSSVHLSSGGGGDSIIAGAGGTNTGGLAQDFNINAGNGGNASGNDTNLGGGGGYVRLNAGNAGTGGTTASGGYIRLTAGAGSTSANDGSIWASVQNNKLSLAGGLSQMLTVNNYGIGIGGGSAGYGIPLNLVWYVQDASAIVFGAQFGTIVSQTSDNSNQVLTNTFYLNTGTDAFNITGAGLEIADFELHINKTGGTIDNAKCIVNYPYLYGNANVTNLIGTQTHLINYGTGTIATAYAYDTAITIGDVNVSGGPGGNINGNITLAAAYRGYAELSGIGSTPGVMALANIFYVSSPIITSTGKVTEINAFKNEILNNTLNHTASSGSFINRAAYFTVGNQSTTGSSTAINTGIYITGNGGTGSGTTNYAINSVSTAQSVFSGLVTINALLQTIASASGSAGFNIPHGVAPSSPVNGDIWTTTSGMFVRINGATKAVTLT